MDVLVSLNLKDFNWISSKPFTSSEVIKVFKEWVEENSDMFSCEDFSCEKVIVLPVKGVDNKEDYNDYFEEEFDYLGDSDYTDDDEDENDDYE